MVCEVSPITGPRTVWVGPTSHGTDRLYTPAPKRQNRKPLKPPTKAYISGLKGWDEGRWGNPQIRDLILAAFIPPFEASNYRNLNSKVLYKRRKNS